MRQLFIACLFLLAITIPVTAQKTYAPAATGGENTSNKDTDATMAANSDSKYPSQKAAKAYADAGLAVKITSNVAITPGTKTKITYDAKGLVTSGADATTADIADSSDRRYMTDAQKTVLQNTSGANTGDETQGTIVSKLGFTPLNILSGTTNSIGGGILAAGACATGTVTISGATTSMVAVASPAAGTDPTNGGVLGVAVDARVSSSNTVTVSVCSPVAGTPAAATYNVRVIP